MSNFHDIKFPDDISHKAKSKVEFSNYIAESKSGFEQINIGRELPKQSFEIDWNSISSGDAERIKNFFIARKGSAYTFRFKNWQDYSAKNQVIGTGNGVKTTFQIIKEYGDVVSKLQKKITKPINGTVSIYVAGNPILSGFSINYTSGIITFDTPPGSGNVISVDFQFDTVVRFKKDFISFVVENYAKSSADKIELLEVL